MKEINVASNGKLRVERLGETRVMNCGKKATIIRYDGSSNISVKFEDGIVVKNTTYSRFMRGTIGDIASPNRLAKIKHTGEVRFHYKSNLKMTLVAYRNKEDVDVLFEDGTLVQHVRYNRFKNGKVGCFLKDYDSLASPRSKIYRDFTLRYKGLEIGEGCFSVTYSGLVITIKTYRSANDIDIQFEDDSTVFNKTLDSFKCGGISHPTFKLSGKGVVKGSYLGTFDVLKLAYRLKDPRDVYYICQCKKCGYKDILTPTEMLAHKCKV